MSSQRSSKAATVDARAKLSLSRRRTILRVSTLPIDRHVRFLHKRFSKLHKLRRWLHPAPLIADRHALRSQCILDLTKPAPIIIGSHHADRIVEFLNPAEDRQVTVYACEISNVVDDSLSRDPVAGKSLKIQQPFLIACRSPSPNRDAARSADPSREAGGDDLRKSSISSTAARISSRQLRSLSGSQS
jgi:hypothetical protein